MSWHLKYRAVHAVYGAGKAMGNDINAEERTYSHNLRVDSLEGREEAITTAKEYWERNPEGHLDRGDPRLVWEEPMDLLYKEEWTRQGQENRQLQPTFP